MVKEILKKYSFLFKYPEENYKENTKELGEILKNRFPEIYEKYREFETEIIKTDIDTLREIYTRTFDLNPSCPPYIGYHLFEDSYKKGEFLVSLKEVYKNCGFEFDEKELPDHLSIILEFISFKGFDDENVKIIIDEGLMLSFDKMRICFKNGKNPYKSLIESLELLLKKGSIPEIKEKDNHE